MSLYPEKVLARVCSATEGLCTKRAFLPSLFHLKEALDQAGFEIHEEEVRRQIAFKPAGKPAESVNPKEGCYDGPIEQIKPGDTLHYSRYEEYRIWLKQAKGINTKMWGVGEAWEDNGARPFDNLHDKTAINQIATKPQPTQKENTNPFEI